MHEFKPFAAPDLQQTVELPTSPQGVKWSGKFTAPAGIQSGSFEAAEHGGGTRVKNRRVWISTDEAGEDVVSGADKTDSTPHIDIGGDDVQLTEGSVYYAHQMVMPRSVSEGQSTETIIILVFNV